MADLLRLASRTRSELLQASPWAWPHEAALTSAEGPSQHGSDELRAIHAARREATLRRLGAGGAAWNAWAATMTSLRRKAGDDPALARLWQLLAGVELVDETFDGEFDVAGFHFPGAARFAGSAFGSDAWFTDARFSGPVDFRDATFGRDAFFERARFAAGADFGGVHFKRSAEFRELSCAGTLGFVEAEFSGSVWFRSSFFEGPVRFRGARFGWEAGLGDCRYRGPADFAEVDFADNAGFENAIFEQSATFADTRFCQAAWFSGVQFRGEAVFDRTRFLGRRHFDGIAVSVPQTPVATQAAVLERLRAAFSG